MKTKHLFILKTVKFTFLTFMVMCFHYTATAQNNQIEPKKEAKIKIIKIEDGKKTTTEKSLAFEEITNLQEFLEQNEIFNEINLNDGEQVEIIIKKGEPNQKIIINKNDIDIDIDFDEEFINYEFDDELLEQKLEQILINCIPPKQTRAQLGIIGKTLTNDKATELNFVETKGVLVTKVIEGSAAQNIGLNPNDVIVNFNNTPINNYNDLITQINQQKPNNQVEITYLSNGAQLTKTAILGESQSQNFNYNYEYKINENGTTKPFLGITQMSNNQQQNEIIVSKVLPNTTAQEMGILPNDIITQFNQQTVESFEHLAQLIKNQQVGDSITVQLKRNNQTIELSGVLKAKQSHDKVIHLENVNQQNQTHIYQNNDKVKMVIVIKNPTTSEEDEILTKTGTFDNQTSKLHLPDFKISPNPGNGNFELTFTPQHHANCDIYVFDQTGKKIIEKSIKTAKNQITYKLDIEKEPAGIYFLIISQNQQTFVKKLIKN